MRAGRRSTSAFTLIELLIVIALSGLLLFLLFEPIEQGFRITNRTKALVQAQDATRFGLQNMEREIGEAAYVFDNTNTTINLPLEAGPTLKRKQNGTAIYSAGTIAVSYGRLDLIPVDLNGASNVAIDPTTGAPIGGGSTRVPGAPSSTRYVRYFVALRDPSKYYANNFVFGQLRTGIDNDFNPFVLYRAQYSPYDTTLVSQNASGTPDMSSASGAFGDPDFFYNGPHAAAWRAASSPVVSGTNLDILNWQKQSNGQFDSPSFHLATSFAPSTIVGDTATPGFITLANSDAAGAVPTLYTAKSGQWTLPFTVNIYRGVGTSQNGTLSLAFAYSITTGVLGVTANGTGSMASPTVYCLYSASTGRYFVSVPGKVSGISFWVDPARGRIETGIVPISSSNGAPIVYAYGSTGTLDTSTTVTLPSGGVQTGYELVPTLYRTTTLDTTNSGASVADPTSGAPVYVPINQGILFADLSAPTTTGTSAYSGYFPTNTQAMTINNVAAGMKLASPFTSYAGSILAPGTEHVVGPDNNLTVAPRYGATQAELFNYYRIGNTNDTGNTNTQPSKTLPGQLYNRSGALSYRFDVNYKYSSTPIIDFGVSQLDYTLPTTGSPATNYQTFLARYGFAGLPAQPEGATATTTSTAQSLAELQVSFLWQNNFARDANGNPLGADGNIANAANGGSVTPEPDVFRLDYATRSLLNLSLGAAVYDSSGGAPQIAQISDKVKINNVGQ